MVDEKIEYIEIIFEYCLSKEFKVEIRVKRIFLVFLVYKEFCFLEIVFFFFVGRLYVGGRFLIE